MKTRRNTRSSDVSANFQEVLENLHVPQEIVNRTGMATERSTLVEASKQDVDKLLDRASVRGAAAAKAQSKRSRQDLSSGCRKRGKQKATLGETSLFYQRKGTNKNQCDKQFSSSRDTLICGAKASTLLDVKYGESNEQDTPLPSDREPSSQGFDDIGKSVSNVTETLDMNMDSDQLHLSNSRAKEIQVLQKDCSTEDGFDWEVGSGTISSGVHNRFKACTGEISIEINTGTPEISEKHGGRGLVRKATMKDKEFAELVHKAHLLCLIARGRIVDNACNDPLLQASLLSMVPPQISFHDTQCTSVLELGPLVKWFQSTFQICPEKGISSHLTDAQEDFTTGLLSALGSQAGSGEEVAALSVALFRGLGLTARYVAVLDVASIKPNASSLEASADWDSQGNVMETAAIDNFSQRYVNRKCGLSLGEVLAQCAPQSLPGDTNAKPLQVSSASNISGTSSFEGGHMGCRKSRGLGINEVSKSFEDQALLSCSKSGKGGTNNGARRQVRKNLRVSRKEESSNSPCISSDACEIAKGSKKKGDLEFELQLEMAMAATAAGIGPKVSERDDLCAGEDDGVLSQKSVPSSSTSERYRGKLQIKDAISHSKATGAVWARKMGPLLHWAEVYCGESDGGRWVHVDAGRGILDGAGMVEGAVASCKCPLRYVVAFAGNGVKDVTCRYVRMWSAIVPLRVDSEWWNATLTPLKALEAAATCGVQNVQNNSSSILMDASCPVAEKSPCFGNDTRGTNHARTVSKTFTASLSSQVSQACDRSSLEDMELETRAYTEPLPTNQQAYKNHHLYVLERWLTKYQTLHPRGPVLGYCAGHPVFPRTCVQNLHTAHRWLQEGLKVKDGENPAKIVKNHRLAMKQDIDDASALVEEIPGEGPVTALFGKWQTEPWQPPPAIGGIVPKNERGNVEVWSEKCVPPGTVHIRLPRILPIAKKLDIDFAPAMVGFEIRNRRSVPIFEGIVICQEYESVLLEAYADEERRRNAEAENKREGQAIARWCQLLRSIATRQRLQATYEVPGPSVSIVPNSSPDKDHQNPSKMLQSLGSKDDTEGRTNAANIKQTKHEHTFPEQNQRFDEAYGIRTKICPCGFILTVEEM